MAGLRKVGAAAESDGGAAKELSATRGRDKFELLLGFLSDARRKTARLSEMFLSSTHGDNASTRLAVAWRTARS